MKKLLLLWAIVSLGFSSAVPVLAQEDSRADEQSEEKSDARPEEKSAEYRPITSVDALTIGKRRANSLARAAEYCVEHEEFDKAIKFSKMAIEQNDDDNETHQVYAEALEGKLRGQTNRDPMIFNQCVKEWLIVLRQEVGDEKLTSHGLGIPGMGALYQDSDRVIPARSHLKRLTGRTPKVWETDNKYLQKVLMPTTETVTGKMVKDQSEKTLEESRK